MGFEVTLLSTGHTFEAEPQESVLEAALRSGINLSYHCNTGSCGECKARIVEGNTEACRHYDYVIPESEKLNNTVLLCSVAPKSDLIIDAHEAASAADIPHQAINVKVARLELISDQNLVLHLRTPRSRTLRFLAGQWVTLKADGMKPANFYIASCPCNGMVIQLHLQKGENTSFFDFATRSLRVGQNMELEGPYGHFTLDEESRRPIVMVAMDQGFAPMKSIIEHAIALDLPQSMYLFWLVQQGRDHYQSNYCRSWEDALDCFIYRPFHLDKQADGVNNDYASGVHYVLDRTPVESEVDLYLSGPGDMVEYFSSAFGEKGTPKERIHVAEKV